jgi:hypothetical protein
MALFAKTTACPPAGSVEFTTLEKGHGTIHGSITPLCRPDRNGSYHDDALLDGFSEELVDVGQSIGLSLGQTSARSRMIVCSCMY